MESDTSLRLRAQRAYDGRVLLARQVHTSILHAAPAVWTRCAGHQPVSGQRDGFHPVHEGDGTATEALLNTVRAVLNESIPARWPTA